MRWTHSGLRTKTVLQIHFILSQSNGLSSDVLSDGWSTGLVMQPLSSNENSFLQVASGVLSKAQTNLERDRGVRVQFRQRSTTLLCGSLQILLVDNLSKPPLQALHPPPLTERNCVPLVQDSIYNFRNVFLPLQVFLVDFQIAKR